MRTSQIRKLKNAGFSELWRDPDNGQLYIREHAWNVLKGRRNGGNVSASSSESLKQESALCQTSQVAETEDGEVSEANKSQTLEGKL